ncbi:MAG: hypothetical protein H9535_07645 [Ignavibacteria bacterium]|nr:hypothetical protein [Ignavibacteria bacterium]
MLRVNKHEFRLTNHHIPKQDSLIVTELSKGPRIVIQRHGEIGYVRIPHMPFVEQTQIDKYANMLNDSVCKVSSVGVKAWIVDLRMNAGGNFRPMLAGIASLLCDGILGGFVNSDGKTSEVFELRNGQLFINDNQEVTVSRIFKQNCQLPMAVLIGSSTGSSGEVTAIVLTGRSTTKFFGQPTFGMANSTQGFYLSNKQIYILLTTAQLKNSKGKKFNNRVLPDQTFKHSIQLNLENDKLVEVAEKWLSSQMK